MKLTNVLSVAMMAVLLVAGHVYGQASSSQSSPGGVTSSYFMGADGQAYMMVPDDSAAAAASQPNGIGLASYNAGGACGCGDKGCTSIGCDSRGCGGCCGGGWSHRVAVFGDYLYLRARNAEVPFAVRMNGPITAQNPIAIQTSPVGNLDPDFNSGFRAGFAVAGDSCNEIRTTYTQYESTQTGLVSSVVTPTPNDVVFPLAQHPAALNAASTGQLVTGQHDIDFDLVDVDYRQLFSYSCNHRYAWLVGVRYARLDQNFISQNLVNNTVTVTSDIDMDGVGLRLGFDGERSLMNPQLLGYARANANFVASEFRANFREGTNLDPVLVDTGYTAGRVVTMLDLEVGGGLQSECGNWRVTAGWMLNAWFNTIQTDEWINAVHANNYDGLGSALTFDGLVARVEGRF